MKQKPQIFITILGLFICTLIYSQDPNYVSIELEEASLKSKHGYAVWRTDYYICTGIAYAKSIGQTVEEFAEFVGARHSLTGPNDTSISAAIKSANYVMTCYPKGQFQILSESDSIVVTKFNIPYKGFFRNGPVLGVTINEFERYLYGLYYLDYPFVI